MSVGMTVLCIILAVVVAAALGILLYLICSPMPVVKLLRRQEDGEIKRAPEYEKARGKVRIRKDLTYPSRYGQNTYDLYLPKETPERRDTSGKAAGVPLILWVHGGAFVAGDKSGIETWGVMLASEGYAVASINYGWAPEYTYPAQVRQVGEALAAAGALCGETDVSDDGAMTGNAVLPAGISIDRKRVILAGDSTGAYLAVQYAMAQTNPTLAERLGITPLPEEEKPKGALLYCGPYDIRQALEIENKMLRFLILRIGWSFLGKKNWRKSPLIDTVTPMAYVTKESVPCYITDGNSFSFEGHGRALGEALRAKGVPVKERYFDRDAGEVSHEYQVDLTTENGQLCFGDTLEFLEQVL